MSPQLHGKKTIQDILGVATVDGVTKVCPNHLGHVENGWSLFSSFCESVKLAEHLKAPGSNFK